MNRKLLIFGFATFVLLAWGLYQALVASPTIAVNANNPQLTGDIFRIFYYHLPSAILAFTLFFGNLLASVWYLIKRDRRADALAVSTAEVGIAFCTVVLVTGPIWAKPVWGVWWTWDARLTSTLVLWLIYVSYLVLRRFSVGSGTAIVASALAIFGFVDVPFVYMANRLFRTAHPQPMIGGGEGSGLDSALWPPLLWNLLAFSAFAAMLVVLRYRLERMRHELEDAQLAADAVAVREEVLR